MGRITAKRSHRSLQGTLAPKNAELRREGNSGNLAAQIIVSHENRTSTPNDRGSHSDGNLSGNLEWKLAVETVETCGFHRFPVSTRRVETAETRFRVSTFHNPLLPQKSLAPSRHGALFGTRILAVSVPSFHQVSTHCDFPIGNRGSRDRSGLFVDPHITSLVLSYPSPATEPTCFKPT